jgi:hypothetical protein
MTHGAFVMLKQQVNFERPPTDVLIAKPKHFLLPTDGTTIYYLINRGLVDYQTEHLENVER